MKKFLALIMALAMVFALTACGPTTGNESVESEVEVIIISSENSTTTDTSSDVPSNVPSQTTPTSSQAPAACTHKNVQVTPAVPSSCSAEGKTEGKVCKDCGAVLLASKSIPKDEHIFNPATDVAPATCALCGVTKGSAAGPEVPPASVTNPTLTKNGATLTFSINQVKYVENNTKCNIIYDVKIVNGSTECEHSWTVDVLVGDSGRAFASGIAASTGKTLAAGEVYNGTFETGPVTAAGHMGYRLEIK